ncbi:ATP-dependent DNA ligase [Streptomyces sp. NPDC051636]|uniref:ATP-dependent DNA ligase n=1 Tax=Streptomyces sp. NPDC051636 TaxID=3365663 RepID=UPI003798333E
MLEVSGAVLVDQPLHQRRIALENLFASLGLAAPWALCPQTTDAATARTWLDPAWGAAGVEGVMIKDSDSRYRPGERGRLKLRTRMTAEGIIGAVTGTARSPLSLLLGRFDARGRLRLVARSTPLSRKAVAELGAVLRPAGPEHPWWGREFSAGWGTKEVLVFQPVVPDLVAEVDADTALDLGRHRHPVRYLRLRDDMAPGDVREPTARPPRAAPPGRRIPELNPDELLNADIKRHVHASRARSTHDLTHETRRFLRRRQRQPHIDHAYFHARHVRYPIR